MGLILNILYGVFLMALAPQAFCTTFADKPDKNIVSENPEFLKKVGLDVESEIISSNGKRQLVVTFKSSAISNFNDVRVEVLLVGANSQLLLAVENPFPNAVHITRYIIPSGSSLMVSVVKNMRENSTYHKVVFENK